jgi:hypothetical protein
VSGGGDGECRGDRGGWHEGGRERVEHANRDYRQIALEILKEADRIDREEDELYGDQRGDELPEHLRTAEGRRAALKEAKRRLERERAANRDRPRGPIADPDPGGGSEEPVGAGSLELDPEVIVTRVQGR